MEILCYASLRKNSKNYENYLEIESNAKIWQQKLKSIHIRIT